MKILAVEFSTDHRSVAVLADGKICGEAMETATRSTHAFALIEKALADARIEREEIECLAIGLGPGSYTGIRAAIALAQGWQLARSVKLLGIASAECLAARAQAENIFGTINVVIDAQRNELYLARYQITPEVCREITPLALAAPDAVRSQLSAGQIVIGPGAIRWFANAKILFPDAATLGRLASLRNDFLPGEKLEPIYLREPNFVKAPPPRVMPPFIL
jgi:tRNA threonylcarbamoyladenosine biosynthesis protein TsaB